MPSSESAATGRNCSTATRSAPISPRAWRFSKEDRDTNIDRIGYVARLLARNGVIAITAAISPYQETRAAVRAAHEKDGVPFIEVYAEATVAALAERDVKGLYKKALAGEIAHFTGVSDPYEPPTHPEIAVRTDRDTVEQSADQISWLVSSSSRA